MATIGACLSGKPNLSSFFAKLIDEPVNYCIVCLRTEQERRLVKPEAFFKFITAAKIRSSCFDYKDSHICYICERKASNALKMYNAAKFANSMRLILGSMLRDTSHRIRNNDVTKIMRSRECDDLEKTLETTRQFSQCVETQVLLVDTTLDPNVEVTVNTNENESSIVPDDNCKQSGIHEDGSNVDRSFRGKQRNKGTRTGITKVNNESSNISSPDNLIVIDDDDVPSSLPQNQVPSSNIIDNIANRILVTNTPFSTIFENNNSDSFVIKPVYYIGNVTPEAQENPYDVHLVTENMNVLHKNVNNNNFVKSINVPNNTKSLLKPSNFVPEKKSGKSSIIAKKSSFIAKKSSNDFSGSSYIEIQSAIGENGIPFKVFSGDTNILLDNGTILNPNTKKNNDQVGIKKTKYNQTLGSPSIRVDTSCLNTQFQDHLQCVKTNSDGATPSKIPKLPEKKNQKDVDWEDKIPMDVISYADAVDPNPPSWEGVSYVVDTKTEIGDIIDLC